MSLHFSRTATAVALALSFGLVALPACKKKPKPAEPDAPASNVNPPPGPNAAPAPGTHWSDPVAPRGPFFSGPLEAPMRTAAVVNMEQIGKALALFQDTHGALPAGYADKSGKPGLSWRVALLPYIEQGALLSEFKLDEPWDSPANKPLVDKMPKIYAPPNQRTYGFTFVRGFSGPNTWLPPQPPGKAGQVLLGVKTFQISGLSGTILVAEAGEAVVWTKPDEVAVAPNTAPKLGGVFASGFAVAMADGSARFVRKTVSPAALASAVQISGNKVGSLDE